MKKTTNKKTGLRKNLVAPFIMSFVIGPNWSGNVPVDYKAVTASSAAATANADLVQLTSESLTTAANAVSVITLTNSKIVTGAKVRASVIDYSGTFSTNGLPVAAVDAINTTNGTCVVNIMNPGTNALSGVVILLVEVVQTAKLNQI